MLFGAFSECKWNLSIICIQIAAAGFFCSHQLRLFCIPPKTHWRDSADWLRELCSAFILHPPKLLKVPPGTEWIRDAEGKDKESVHCQECPVLSAGTARKGLGIERSSVSERDAEEEGRDHQCPWNTFLPQAVWSCRVLHWPLPNNS